MKDTLEFAEQKHEQEKFFDVFWQLDLNEAVGTFFLGILSLILFVTLRQSQKRYEALIRQMQVGG